jgi:hypothetical protein
MLYILSTDSAMKKNDQDYLRVHSCIITLISDNNMAIAINGATMTLWKS